MISKSFLKSSLIYTVIGALPLASSIVLLPFYTNFLDTSDFGILAIYISFTFLVQIAVNFGLDVFVAVHYFEYKNDRKKLNECIGTVVVLLLIIGLVVSLLSCAAGSIAFEKVFHNEAISFFPFGFMSVLTAICNSFFKTYCSLLINQQRPERFFWVNLFNFILTIGISLAGLYLYPNTLIGPMWGRLLSGVGIFLLAFFFFWREFGLHFNTSFLKEMWVYCYPLASYFILVWVLSYIDRFIINRYMDPSNVGIYDFAVKCTLLIDFLQMGLYNSITPRIFSIWKDKNLKESTPEVNRYYNSFTAITVLLIPIMILLIPLLVPLIVYKQQYYDAFTYLPILALGFIFRGMYNMYFSPIYFFKKTKVLTKVFFLSALFQIILSIFFIKEWGLWGIVWAGFLSKIIQVFFLYLESRKIFRFKLNQVKLFYLPVLFSTAIILMEYFLSDRMNPLSIHCLEFILGCIMVFSVYRKELPVLLKMRKLQQ